MGGARVTTLVTLRKCTLGHKREIKTLKFVSASTKGFKGGLSLDQALQERHGSDFFLLVLRACSRAGALLRRDMADPAPVSRRVSPMDRGRPDRLDSRHSIQCP